MNNPDFTDPEIDRRLSFQIARKGCGLHRERYLCLFDMGNSENLSEESLILFLELAKIHYEADFCAVTSAENNLVERGATDDNCYLLDTITDEQIAYLKFKSRIVISDSEVTDQTVEQIRADVTNALKREKFKRDETTKVAYFKINTSQATKK